MAKPKLNVWLVLAAQNARKSTLIRHLSGVHHDKRVDLATTGAPLNIRVIVSSVNEIADPPEPEDWIEELLAEAEQTGCYNIMLPLRLDETRLRRDPRPYFDELRRVSTFPWVITLRQRQPAWCR